MYALDALDAYNQKLVKRIEVKGFTLKNMRGTDGYLYLKDILVYKNKAPEAVIEFECMGAGGRVRKKTQRFLEGDSIYEASGSTRLEAYRSYTIASGNDGIVPPQDGRPGYVRFLDRGIGDDGRVFIGDIYNDSAAGDMQRVQIRETIKSHLQKEEALFRRGIKCLSLFFIDEVAKYRDLSGNGGTVGYGKVFEEEYSAIVDDRLKHPTADDVLDPSYAQYLGRFDAHSVHSGYFSIDKKGNAVESKAEKKSEREDGIGINDDDAKRAYFPLTSRCVSSSATQRCAKAGTIRISSRFARSRSLAPRRPSAKRSAAACALPSTRRAIVRTRRCWAWTRFIA